MQDNQPSLTPEQRSSEWFAQRLGKVTASRVADCMAWGRPNKDGVAKELTARKNYREGIVAERLTGLPADPEPYVSYDMKWGITNEAIAKNVYQLAYKRIVNDAPFVQHKTLLAGASPDGYVTDTVTGEIGLVEIKCLRSANHLFKAILTQEVPAEYYPQIQMQLWITGYDWCDFIAFDSRLPEGLQIFVKRVERDNKYITDTLEPEVRKFLGECDNQFKHFWAKVKNKLKIENGVVVKNEVLGYKDTERN